MERKTRHTEANLQGTSCELATTDGMPGPMVINRFNAESESLSLSTLDRLRIRDPRAWERLSTLFSPLVYYWVLKAGAQAEDAQDLVQEVFRVVLMRIDDFRRDRPGSTFRGWLFAITKNKLAAHRRRHLLAPRARGGSDAVRWFEQIEADDELEFDADSGIESLCHRVLTLINHEFNETDWTVFTRVVVEQRRPDEVAQDLQISVNSVYLAKSRILRRLRQEIGSLRE
jgi:RNA polymerase sigma-70 factor (ECF subfamily)